MEMEDPLRELMDNVNSTNISYDTIVGDIVEKAKVEFDKIKDFTQQKNAIKLADELSHEPSNNINVKSSRGFTEGRIEPHTLGALRGEDFNPNLDLNKQLNELLKIANIKTNVIDTPIIDTPSKITSSKKVNKYGKKRTEISVEKLKTIKSIDAAYKESITQKQTIPKQPIPKQTTQKRIALRRTKSERITIKQTIPKETAPKRMNKYEKIRLAALAKK